jgi:hypothetical protein
MKLTNRDLQLIFEAAKQHYLDDSKDQLDNQQVVARSYVKAVAAKLGVEVEFEQRILIEPVED